VYGCADETATNYMPTATASTGCAYSIVGCGDSRAKNYAADVTAPDANLCTFETLGCMSASAINFNPAATKDDGSCIVASPPSPPNPPPKRSPPPPSPVLTHATTEVQNSTMAVKYESVSKGSMDDMIEVIIIAVGALALLSACVLGRCAFRLRKNADAAYAGKVQQTNNYIANILAARNSPRVSDSSQGRSVVHLPIAPARMPPTLPTTQSLDDAPGFSEGGSFSDYGSFGGHRAAPTLQSPGFDMEDGSYRQAPSNYLPAPGRLPAPPAPEDDDSTFI
jgi:hypothetical protein